MTAARRGITPGGKLLIFDTVVPGGNTPHFSKFFDLNMLVMTGGRERTEGEWRALLDGAGLRPERIEDGLIVATCP